MSLFGYLEIFFYNYSIEKTLLLIQKTLLVSIQIDPWHTQISTHLIWYKFVLSKNDSQRQDEQKQPNSKAFIL